MAGSILNLLKHDPLIKDLLLEKNFAVSLNEAPSIIGSLDKLPLLHHLMRVCPLPELQFEELFVAMRSLLLKNLDKMEVSPELIYFLSTLSIHCFTNEYVYAETDEEEPDSTQQFVVKLKNSRDFNSPVKWEPRVRKGTATAVLSAVAGNASYYLS